MPVAVDYTAIEAAVVEAAMAGCKTIWIVCNDDIAPIVRYRVGDFIQDPLHFYNNYNYNISDRRMKIPIYWVPIHPKDRDKRDCLSWSVLHGAVTSLKISSQISKWLIPDKYYVSFPYGIFDPRPLQKIRNKIRSKNNFYVSYNNKTVSDNIYSSFTFGKDEFIQYRRNVRRGTGMYTSEVKNKHGIPRSKLPIEERWSARFFELEDVFTPDTTGGAYTHEVAEFYNLNNWENYRQYMCSNFSNVIRRPSKELFSYREFNRIAVDRD